MRRKWIVAHRGDHSRAPENSIAAFEDAIAAGADMIEFDVRRAAGGMLVVSHDEPGAGVRVPLLSEVLQVCAGRILLDIELKDFGCEEEVAGALAGARIAPRDCILTSFDAPQLARIRRGHPEFRTGLLTERLPAQLETDYLAPHFACLTDAALEQFAANHLPLLPWTVNDPVEIERLLAAPAVAGVITDRVREAVQLASR